MLHGVGHRSAQQAQRPDQAGQADDHQDDGSPARAPAEPATEALTQRIEGDRQDHRPQHQVEERLEDVEAEQHQHGDQPGADQYIEQFPGSAQVNRAIIGHEWALGQASGFQ
ncbi:hypothetical protein D9M71_753670 [compost metagenome]